MCPQIVLEFSRVSIQTAKVDFRPPHDLTYAEKQVGRKLFYNFSFFFFLFNRDSTNAASIYELSSVEV
jgi:hypothetical protein